MSPRTDHAPGALQQPPGDIGLKRTVGPQGPGQDPACPTWPDRVPEHVPPTTTVGTSEQLAPAEIGRARHAVVARHLRLPENELGIERGDGVHLFDRKGRSWVDLSAGTLNLALGYSDPDVADAVAVQMRVMSHASSRFTPSIVREFLNLVAEHVAHPACSDLSFRLSNGSDANEALVKASRRFTGRRTILVQFLSHLGESAETHSLSGKDFESKRDVCGSQDRQFVAPPDCAHCPVKKTPATCNVECATWVEYALEQMRGEVAGVLVEPVIVNRGVLYSSRTHEYLLRIQAATKAAGVPFLVDEVQAWPWVDGMSFTSYFGLNPDGQSFAKGIASGLAVAVAAMRPELADALNYNDAEHTHGGNPPACAGAAAGIRRIVGNEWHIHEKSVLLAAELSKISTLPGVAAVRQIGLIAAIDFDRGDRAAAQSLASKVYTTALQNGVILRRAGACILIKPPIVIEPVDLANALQVVASAIEEATCLWV